MTRARYERDRDEDRIVVDGDAMNLADASELLRELGEALEEADRAVCDREALRRVT